MIVAHGLIHVNTSLYPRIVAFLTSICQMRYKFRYTQYAKLIKWGSDWCCNLREGSALQLCAKYKAWVHSFYKPLISSFYLIEQHFVLLNSFQHCKWCNYSSYWYALHKVIQFLFQNITPEWNGENLMLFSTNLMVLLSHSCNVVTC